MNQPGREPSAGDVPGGALAAVVAVAIVAAALVLYGVGAAVLRAGRPGEEGLSGRSVALVVCAALLGALPHVLWSLSVSIGCRELRWRAVFAHVLSLPVAIVLAGVLAFDAGFVSLERDGLVSVERADPHGLAALAAAAGVFADAARRALLRLLGLKRKAT